MLCDELKVYVPQDGPWGLEPEEGGKLVEEETCYLKSEVDAAIAELKQKLEDVQASAYAESVDAGMENRRLKEERRWRKFSEEKPDDKHVVLVSDGEWFETAFYHDDGSIDFGDDIHFSNITEAPYWMPLPPAPKEAK